MFRETNKDKQGNLFSNMKEILPKSSYDLLSDPQAWHTMFFKHVYNNIDEKVFASLYSRTMGAPNASLRAMVCMMILKEGFGLSDADLYENLRFNILYRSALGFFNLDDELPGTSTYYLFRKRLAEHVKNTGEDLLNKAFQSITCKQALDFQVSGKRIRMDSKLVGSNIAWYTRYELIHESLHSYLQSTSLVSEVVSAEFFEKLRHIVEEPAKSVVYRHDKASLRERMGSMGILIGKLLRKMKKTDSNNPAYSVLSRVFREQYDVNMGEVSVREKERISAKSVQTPHDPDAEYRKKGNAATKGYSMNVTETCDSDSVHLITDIQVAGATHADNNFLQKAVVRTEKHVLGTSVEDIHTDGAYYSQENVAYAEREGKQLHLSGMQGARGRYELVAVGDNDMRVTDRLTGEVMCGQRAKNGKLRIDTGRGYRYFGEKELQTVQYRASIESIPQSIRAIRNNVEATIFHMSCRLRHNKTRYRGKHNHTMWAVCRALWINCVRLTKHVRQEAILSEMLPIERLNSGITVFFKKIALLGTDFSSARIVPVQ